MLARTIFRQGLHRRLQPIRVVKTAFVRSFRLRNGRPAVPHDPNGCWTRRRWHKLRVMAESYFWSLLQAGGTKTMYRRDVQRNLEPSVVDKGACTATPMGSWVGCHLLMRNRKQEACPARVHTCGDYSRSNGVDAVSGLYWKGEAEDRGSRVRHRKHLQQGLAVKGMLPATNVLLERSQLRAPAI